jgi:multiple sugar transport system permease protein
LPIGLSAFQDKFSVEYNLLMAASLIVMVPTLLVFLFNQRFFIRGIQLSGMKQ